MKRVVILDAILNRHVASILYGVVSVVRDYKALLMYTYSFYKIIDVRFFTFTGSKDLIEQLFRDQYKVMLH